MSGGALRKEAKERFLKEDIKEGTQKVLDGSDDASSLSDKKLYGYAGCNPDLIEEKEFKTNVPKAEKDNFMFVYTEEKVKESVQKLKVRGETGTGVYLLTEEDFVEILGSALI